jgi:hypothetical protein
MIGESLSMHGRNQTRSRRNFSVVEQHPHVENGICRKSFMSLDDPSMSQMTNCNPHPHLL